MMMAQSPLIRQVRSDQQQFSRLTPSEQSYSSREVRCAGGVSSGVNFVPPSRESNSQSPR